MVLTERQLFLSSRVVADSVIIPNGGVLVDENGLIEKIVTKKQADDIIKKADGKIKVRKTSVYIKLNHCTLSLFYVNLTIVYYH